MEDKPVFRTFESSEGLKEWALWAFTSLAIIFEGQAIKPTRLARQQALAILSEPDCRVVRATYRKAALDFFPRTREDTADPQMQANAVVINGAYKKRQEGSCRRRATTSTDSKENAAADPQPEAPPEEPEASPEEPEAPTGEEESPTAEEGITFSVGKRLFQWVKWSALGVGLGGTTLYVSKECTKHKPGRRLRRVRSVGRLTRYSSDSQ